MNIVVLSRNASLYSTSRLVEAALLRGHQIEVLDHLKCSVLMEAGAPCIYYKGKTIQGIDAVIPRIGASVTFYGTAVVRQFETMGAFSATKSQAISRSRDKLRSLQVLSRSGIGIPKTAFANHPKEVDDLIAQVGGVPVVIKLLEGTQGIGVVLAETATTARSVIQAFYGLQANIMVQEFIHESEGADVRAFVVDGEVVGAMRRQGKEGEFRSNLHRGGKGEMIKLNKQQKHAALNACKLLGLDIAGVDMLLSKRGPLILEVNSSPGLQGIETATGVDIAGKIISYIERNVPERHSRRDKIGI
jgi:ribosomal protein S6--L-glutamate ligase